MDTAERDDVVEEEGGASGAADDGSEGRLPDVDTAERDDVVEEEGGASGAADDGSEGRLPDVDTAQRDDVVEEEGDATGRAANAPAPTGLRVTSDTDDSVSLSWNAGTDAYRYKVEYRRSSSSSWLHAGYTSGTSRTVSELDPNTAYDFQVRARGDGSPYSYTYGSPSTSVVEDHRLPYSPRSHRPPCNCIYRDQCQPELECRNRRPLLQGRVSEEQLQQLAPRRIHFRHLQDGVQA